ncbi:tRNA uridine-5-carboxymethylaminomethyl(34) synthesis GTPase MnmE [Caproiciproducens galactitolivorans]|uniref:tRNA modification GTPase MnmE n=1 Tax=Caproiciproducens galactitolivorans TaxID=642589 RepID=A0ABT4BUW5_9FIRM|nr:tRNA uridine-5-carboxymethylaminomethyl(34) synthesis GTPase MnmE [Caproiciproducens galactitolivorans]MCY1714693.1 tRNA uridine-5-carboxymethylaminomethyl(34) synthesis GTPase MnmE [Caproiciproducens galactitolivorans]
MENRETYSPSSKTIAAISTPQAPGGIGIVRISGPRAREIAGKVFTSKRGKTLDEIKGYTALYGRVHDGDEAIDEAIALNYTAPASFTGEDVVELSCHGGLYLLRRVLKAVFSAGAVPAGPGEFTRRAFLNGKIGLTEAESVMQLIGAQGGQAAKAALAGHDGALEKKIRKIRESLIQTAAHLSAWADYPEDDIPEVNEESLHETLRFAKEELDRLLSQFDAGRAIREGVVTVIAGRPNVGKSTLMNLLSGCERSIVTEYAGTTRDIVEDTVILGDVPLRLSDTAGIHLTEDPVELIGVERARERIREAQLILAVFDSSQGLNDEDRELVSVIRDAPSIAVVNKSDLPAKIDLEYIKYNFKRIVYISALSGEGLEQLKNAVAELLHTAGLNPAEGILFTERQRDAARRAGEGVDEALAAVESGITLDAVTVSIEGAISALLELTGERATEAVVDSVFHHFCVGK